MTERSTYSSHARGGSSYDAVHDQVIVCSDNDETFDRLARFQNILDLIPGWHRVEISDGSRIGDAAMEGGTMLAQGPGSDRHLAIVTSRVEGHLWSFTLMSSCGGEAAQQRVVTLAFRPVFGNCCSIVAQVQGPCEPGAGSWLFAWLEALKRQAGASDDHHVAVPDPWIVNIHAADTLRACAFDVP